MNTARTRLVLNAHRRRILDDVGPSIPDFVPLILAAAILALTGFGIYRVAHQETMDEAYVRGITEDCITAGYTPHIHRDAHGKILGASCAREAKP